MPLGLLLVVWEPVIDARNDPFDEAGKDDQVGCQTFRSVHAHDAHFRRLKRNLALRHAISHRVDNLGQFLCIVDCSYGNVAQEREVR